LKEALTVFSTAAEEDSQFLEFSGCLESLTETLLNTSAAGTRAFAGEGIRHGAMEAVMFLAIGHSEDVAQPEGAPLLEDVVTLNALAAGTLGLCETQAKLSATAGAQDAQLERLSVEVKRVHKLESRLAECCGAAVAESRVVQEQLAPLRAALLSQVERLGLQFKDATAAAAARESSWLERALETATEQSRQTIGRPLARIT